MEAIPPQNALPLSAHLDISVVMHAFNGARFLKWQAAANGDHSQCAGFSTPYPSDHCYRPQLKKHSPHTL